MQFGASYIGGVLSWLHKFIKALGWVGSGQLFGGLGWDVSKKIDPWTTLGRVIVSRRNNALRKLFMHLYVFIACCPVKNIPDRQHTGWPKSNSIPTEL